jgi:hypothetical protein
MSMVFGSITTGYLLAVAGICYIVWWLLFGK